MSKKNGSEALRYPAPRFNKIVVIPERTYTRKNKETGEIVERRFGTTMSVKWDMWGGHVFPYGPKVTQATCSVEDTFDPEVGFAICLAKKLYTKRTLARIMNLIKTLPSE